MTSSSDRRRGPERPGVRRVLDYWGPVLVYCGAIFLQSSFPSPAAMPTFFMSDKLLHTAAYAVMAVLFFRALGIHRIGADPAGRALFAIAFTVLYGIGDEIHQYFVPGRFCEGWDVAADAVGAVLGVFLALKYIGPETPRVAGPID